MKQFEITTNKRLLIVEMTGELDTADVFSWNNQPVEKICEGSELTEEIAKGLVEILWNGFKNYNEKEPVGNYNRLVVNTALESFKSAIESKGYHWGENPVKYPTKENYGYSENINVLDYPPEWDEECYHEDMDKWKVAESRTFNPSKSIIFEIM